MMTSQSAGMSPSDRPGAGLIRLEGMMEVVTTTDLPQTQQQGLDPVITNPLVQKDIQ